MLSCYMGAGCVISAIQANLVMFFILGLKGGIDDRKLAYLRI